MVYFYIEVIYIRCMLKCLYNRKTSLFENTYVSKT